MNSLADLLKIVIESNTLHAKWLNTLSYLENCGARKIASCEHPTKVKEEMLKHAAEEFRHAHYLKRQIERVSKPLPDYSQILGGVATVRYLDRLDLYTARYLKDLGLSRSAVKEAAYLLVTYAIELRAGELYLLYDSLLRQAGSKVTVKSILLEEKEHLNEMEQALHKLPSGLTHAAQVIDFETALFQKWLAWLNMFLWKQSNGAILKR